MKNVAKLPIESISPFTLLDYPDYTACILWFAGCNMKCQYCYNPEIVFSEGKLPYEAALDFLKTRQGLLDGVVLSGGECTTKHGFVEFVSEVKSLGFCIKVDTNGSAPWVLESLIQNKLIDYVALDFKAPPMKFKTVTKSKLFNRFERSMKLLFSTNTPFEVRTTFHADLLELSDLKWMGNYLLEQGYEGNYYLQHFVNDTATIADLRNSTVKIHDSQLEFDGLKVVIRN